MKDSNKIIKDTEKYALDEIEKYGAPPLLGFHFVNNKADELASKLKADKNIVGIAIRLIDIKVGYAVSINKLPEHVQMSSDAAKIFLKKYDLDKKDFDKIINCIESHHDLKKAKCIESEICANADCYKFLTVRNWLYFIFNLASEKRMTFDEAIKYSETKVDEKWNILTINVCKKELQNDYKIIKEVIKRIR